MRNGRMVGIVGALVVLALQWGFASRLSIGGASPDLTLVFAVYLALSRPGGGVPALRLWGFGLAVDLLGPFPPGFHALAYPLIGALAAPAAGATDPRSVRIRGMGLAAAGVLVGFLRWGWLAIEGAAPGARAGLLSVGISTALTLAAGLLVMAAMDWASRAPEPEAEAPAAA